MKTFTMTVENPNGAVTISITEEMFETMLHGEIRGDNDYVIITVIKMDDDGEVTEGTIRGEYD